MNHLLLILLGGPVAIGGPIAIVRALVHRHGDPAAAAAYLAWFRAEQAEAERQARLAILRTQQRAAQHTAPKELTR